MSVEPIFNFIQIDEHIATGGQPTRSQLEAALQAGCEAVINLAPDTDRQALPDERVIVESSGARYHQIPVDWKNPLRDQFTEFSELMNSLRGRRILIHCAANFRVTAFYSLYAMKYEGWTREKANQLIARIWESRPDYRMDETWRGFIDAVYREEIRSAVSRE